jgi:hypothetical protein
MDCPKCGSVREVGSEECSVCGIVFSRWRGGSGKEAPAAARSSLPQSFSTIDHSVRLYSVGQIVLATFLGSPAAGGHLLARNERELGDPESARNAMLLGVALTLGLVVVGAFLPNPIVQRALPWVGILTIRYRASTRQGESIAAHVAGGGSMHSWWSAVGIGLAYLAVIFAGIILYVLAKVT